MEYYKLLVTCRWKCCVRKPRKSCQRRATCRWAAKQIGKKADLRVLFEKQCLKIMCMIGPTQPSQNCFCLPGCLLPCHCLWRCPWPISRSHGALQDWRWAFVNIALYQNTFINHGVLPCKKSRLMWVHFRKISWHKLPVHGGLCGSWILQRWNCLSSSQPQGVNFMSHWLSFHRWVC